MGRGLPAVADGPREKILSQVRQTGSPQAGWRGYVLILHEGKIASDHRMYWNAARLASQIIFEPLQESQLNVAQRA